MAMENLILRSSDGLFQTIWFSIKTTKSLSTNKLQFSVNAQNGHGKGRWIGGAGAKVKEYATTQMEISMKEK